MKKIYIEPKINVVTIRLKEVVLQMSGPSTETEGDNPDLDPDGEGDAEEGLSKSRNSWDIFGE